MLNFTLRQLEVFISVVENSGFTAAADELMLAQSTVSVHIKSLEDALGVTLFVRDAKKQILLTDVGRDVYNYAKSVIEQCRIMCDNVSDRANEQKISIAASTDSFEYLLPGILAEYMRMNDGSSFDIVNGDSAFVHEQVLKGYARLCFSGTIMNERDLRYTVLCRDQLVMITPNNDKYRRLKEMGAFGKDLLGEPMIVRGATSGTRKEFYRYLEKNGLDNAKLHIVARMNHADAVKSSVANGLGVAVISEMAAQKYAGNGDLLVFRLDEVGAYRNIYLLCRNDTVFNNAERRFVSFSMTHIRSSAR